MHSITPALWTHTLSTNLTGAFHTIQAAAQQLSAQSPPGGSIIGISSISALVGGVQQAHYTPTKAGVLSLIQSCACALGKYNIRCNALLPGTIRTQLNEEDLADDKKRGYMEGRIPLGRTGVPEDLVGPAVFLGSELSGYVVSFLIRCGVGNEWLTCECRLVRNCWLMGGCLLICSKFMLRRWVYRAYVSWMPIFSFVSFSGFEDCAPILLPPHPNLGNAHKNLARKYTYDDGFAECPSSTCDYDFTLSSPNPSIP